MVQPARLESKEILSSFFLSLLSALLSTMPPARRKKPVLRPSTLAPEAPALAFALALNNNLFQKFIQTYIERVKDQALAAPAVPAAEVRDNVDRPLKPRNPDLYYGHLYIECYYFCQ